MIGNRELKRCPFCDGLAKFHVSDSTGLVHTGELNVLQIRGKQMTHCLVICQRCGIRTGTYLTRLGAFNAWDRRVKDETPL